MFLYFQMNAIHTVIYIVLFLEVNSLKFWTNYYTVSISEFKTAINL